LLGAVFDILDQQPGDRTVQTDIFGHDFCDIALIAIGVPRLVWIDRQNRAFEAPAQARGLHHFDRFGVPSALGALSPLGVLGGKLPRQFELPHQIAGDFAGIAAATA
jgi:hypothetical protein